MVLDPRESNSIGYSMLGFIAVVSLIGPSTNYPHVFQCICFCFIAAKQGGC
jgi:hypothetical protein